MDNHCKKNLAETLNCNNIHKQNFIYSDVNLKKKENFKKYSIFLLHYHFPSLLV